MLLNGITPFRYLYLYSYVLILSFILSVRNLYLYWLLIEVFILLFMAIAYSIKLKSPRSLILYFIIQTLSSFGFLLRVFFCSSLARVFLLLKIAIFPFISWFIKALYNFPPLLLLLRMTFNKLPILLLISTFELILDLNMILFLRVLSLALSRVFIVFTLKATLVLIYSSIRNNIWFFLREELRMNFLLLFFLFYSLSLYAVLIYFNPLTNKITASPAIVLSFINLARVPLLPIFWVKLFLVYLLVQRFNKLYFIVLVLFLRVISTLGYLTPSIKFIFYKRYWA